MAQPTVPATPSRRMPPPRPGQHPAPVKPVEAETPTTPPAVDDETEALRRELAEARARIEAAEARAAEAEKRAAATKLSKGRSVVQLNELGQTIRQLIRAADLVDDERVAEFFDDAVARGAAATELRLAAGRARHVWQTTVDARDGVPSKILKPLGIREVNGRLVIIEKDSDPA